MALQDFQPNQYTQDIWNELVSFFGNEIGAAAMMANLYGESGCTPWRCQGWYGFSAEVVQGCANYYTQVNNGTITREQFAKYGWSKNQTIDTTGKRDGYGLAQWTTQGRKEGLYDSRSGGQGIEELGVQLNWLETELNTSYTSTRDVCINATDLDYATDYVLDHFEVPLTPDYAQREHYAQQIYEQYAGGLSGNPIFMEADGNGYTWASLGEVEVHRAEFHDRIGIMAIPYDEDTFLNYEIVTPTALQLEQPLTIANNYFTMPNETVKIIAHFSGSTPTPPYPPIQPTQRKRKHMPIWMYPMFRI